MGIFDLFLMLGVFLLYGLFFYKRIVSRRQASFLLVGTILLVVFHLFFGFIRWQLYTFYVLYILLFLYNSIELVGQKLVHSRVRFSLMITTSILLVLSFLLVAAFPVYQVPETTGTYEVGTKTYELQDESREELYSDEVDVRRFIVQAHYPIDTSTGYQKAKWIEDGRDVTRALAEDNGLPFFALDHIVEIDSNSYLGAPLSETSPTYPIVVISHGWRGFRNLHTDLAEELASYGFVVFSIDHTYGSVATVFEEETVYLNLDALPEAPTREGFLEHANRLVNTYALDVVSTLDFLEELNVGGIDPMFDGRLDLDRIGLMGHSTGGGADVQVALEDERIRSVLGLDAWVEPLNDETIALGLDVPSLFLRSGSWEEGDNNPPLYKIMNESTSLSKLYQIDGTTHFDFAMVYMYSPLTKYIGFTGSVESERLTRLLREIMLDFFDETLLGSDVDLYDYDQWDEVRLIETP